MIEEAVTAAGLRGVYAVPPLPRHDDARRTLNLDAAARVADHIAAGGISRFLYGGNAFLHHVSLDEYEVLLGWLATFDDSRWAIPSLGPSYGRALDQARLLRRHRFTAAMMLPCSDPRDADGLERGYREIASAAGLPLIAYVKSEDGFGGALESSLESSIEAIGRLVDDGVCIAIKYAIVRDDPADDDYLTALLARVDRDRIISGMGERPAIVHLRDRRLGGLTTGSGCIAPRQCAELFTACEAGDWPRAEAIRASFMPLEDLRDAWEPARVLHHATELAGVAPTGPIPPFVSPLDAAQIAALAPPARALRERES